MIIAFFSEFSFGLSLYHDAIFSYVNTQISSFNLFGAKKLIKLQAKTFLSKGRATFTRANSWQATVSPSRHLMKRPVPHPKISHTQTLFLLCSFGFVSCPFRWSLYLSLAQQRYGYSNVLIFKWAYLLSFSKASYGTVLAGGKGELWLFVSLFFRGPCDQSWRGSPFFYLAFFANFWAENKIFL